MMDFMIIFLDSVHVGQFAKKNRSESFVNHGLHSSQLSQSDSAPTSFSNDRANGHQSTHNITTKFLSAEEHFMFRIRMLLPRLLPSSPLC